MHAPLDGRLGVVQAHALPEQNAQARHAGAQVGAERAGRAPNVSPALSYRSRTDLKPLTVSGMQLCGGKLPKPACAGRLRVRPGGKPRHTHSGPGPTCGRRERRVVRLGEHPAGVLVLGVVRARALPGGVRDRQPDHVLQALHSRL